MIRGAGFVLTPEERGRLIERSRRNAERIFPYIGGEEVNSDPAQRFGRYVINFGSLPLEEAEKWPDLIAIVRERVKPERDGRDHNAIALREKKLWWLYRSDVPETRAAISGLDRCMVNSQVSKHLVFAFQPVDRIFGHTLNVYPIDRHAPFAVMQSRVHEAWARLLSSEFGSSSIGAVLRYTPTDCLRTFPFPHPDPRTVIPSLEAIGERLYEARARFMVDTDQGLTKTYNALKDPNSDDPRVAELRALHEEMDRAVVAAYGWNLPVPPYCPKDDDERAAVQAFEDQVIDKLFALNAERAEEEKKAGAVVGAKQRGGKKKEAAKAGPPAAEGAQVAMFAPPGEAGAPTPGRAGAPARGRKRETT